MNDTSYDESPERGQKPYCIQGSEAPVFRGDAAINEHLMCGAGCGQLLIEHFAKDDYVNIGIKCFQCGEITWTPRLELGEVFGASIVTLGEKGAFRLNSTVNTRPGVILTCDQEIAREIEATAPKRHGLPIEFSVDGLSKLGAHYDRITGGKLSKQREIVSRKGDSSISTFPFAWALSHLEGRLDNGFVNIRKSDTLTALIWLQTFGHVAGVWQHHPRFQDVARDLGKPKSFLHTSSQLIAAAYLYRAGNRVGLSLEDRYGRPNPDLYIRGVAGGKLFIEVKAPEYLQWCGNQEISIAKIEATVRNCVQRSSRQINSSCRGVLIIFSSYVTTDFPAILERSIQKALRSEGRNRKSLAAVIGLSPIHFSFSKENGDKANIETEFHFSVTLNKNYDGENPINTGQLGYDSP